MKNKILVIEILCLMLTIIFTGCGFPRYSVQGQKKLLNSQTVYVYPVHITSITQEEKFDTIIAKKIVDFINEKGDLKAVFVNRNPSVNSEWFMNEAKMYKRSCEAFSGFIKNDLPNGNYALLVEFLWAPNEIDVHYCLLDKEKSKGVFLGLVNSHHPIHKQVNPKSNEDAYNLFCKLYEKDVNKVQGK